SARSGGVGAGSGGSAGGTSARGGTSPAGGTSSAGGTSPAGGTSAGGAANQPPDQRRGEIELGDGDGDPLPGIAYEITTPGGKVVTGKLDSQGRARVDDIDPGSCKVRFPDLDGSEWRPM